MKQLIILVFICFLSFPVYCQNTNTQSAWEYSEKLDSIILISHYNGTETKHKIFKYNYDLAKRPKERIRKEKLGPVYSSFKDVTYSYDKDNKFIKSRSIFEVANYLNKRKDYVYDSNGKIKEAILNTYGKVWSPHSKITSEIKNNQINNGLYNWSINGWQKVDTSCYYYTNNCLDSIISTNWKHVYKYDLKTKRGFCLKYYYMSGYILKYKDEFVFNSDYCYLFYQENSVANNKFRPIKKQYSTFDENGNILTQIDSTYHSGKWIFGGRITCKYDYLTSLSSVSHIEQEYTPIMITELRPFEWGEGYDYPTLPILKNSFNNKVIEITYTKVDTSVFRFYYSKFPKSKVKN